MRAMKDSGIDTVGCIPNYWMGKRLKYLCRIETGNEDTQNANPEGLYPFYVRSPVVERCDRYTFSGEGILVAGDGAGAGRIFHHVNGKYAVHQRVYRLSDFQYNTDFLHYYLSNLFPHEMDKGSAQSTVPSMRLPMLMNFTFFLPPEKEAEDIVAFLDAKCAEINALSADIQSEIDTLEAYKRSVITEAVTKGLDKNVPMKDSGIEWIGTIPETWEIGRVKDYYQLQTGFTPSTEIAEYYDDENGYDWVSIADMNDRSRYIVSTKAKISQKYIDIKHPSCSPKGSLLYSFKLSVGKVAFLDNDMYTNEAVASFLPCSYGLLGFLYYSSMFIEENANINIYGAKILNQDLIKNAYVPFPPIADQKKIVVFLDKKCAEIDFIIAQKQEQLAVLADYKKSVIYEYVTGKKEVPVT